VANEPDSRSSTKKEIKGTRSSIKKGTPESVSWKKEVGVMKSAREIGSYERHARKEKS